MELVFVLSDELVCEADEYIDNKYESDAVLFVSIVFFFLIFIYFF